ncbi:MAG: type II secretion system protein [Candidatus Gracilibacteria bacterium]|jgi:type IV pilus assembly protein PilA
MNRLHKKAFTLIEVLLVIVIIAILAGIVIIAVNPGRQISQANNSQRSSDVLAILDAVHQYGIENRGTLPAAITATATVVGSGATEIDICTDLVPTYLTAIPFDPSTTGAGYTDCTTYSSGYTIAVDADGRVTVAAPDAELAETISVTR